MKKILLFLSIAPLLGVFETKSSVATPEQMQNQNFIIDDHSYHSQALQWTRSYILDHEGNFLVYPKEMQLIANLIYLSFERSLNTLQTQEQALKTLNTFWKGWQNIAQTRMDPSISLPYDIPEQAKQYEHMMQFWHRHDEHRKTGLTYTHAVKNIVDGRSLITVYARDSVDSMRNQARSVIAQSLLNVKNYVGDLFYSQNKFQKILSYINFIWDYLPKLALSSFVEANKTNDLVSEESWEILMKIQNIGTYTWKIIEQDRASFYLAYYKAIWHSMKKLNLETDYFKILFDQNGPAYIDNQFDYLPDPATLEIPYNPPYIFG